MIPNFLDPMPDPDPELESAPNGRMFVPICHEKCLGISSTTGADSKVDLMPQKSLKIRFRSRIRG